MRGKLGGDPGTVRGGVAASMRPARFAREIAQASHIHHAEKLASMRPARFAREIEWCHDCYAFQPAASMRPARFAREIRIRKLIRGGEAGGFNEARAFCAGNSPSNCHIRLRPQRFNEARAFCAGNFSAASWSIFCFRASMRPARFAREISNTSSLYVPAVSGFNEARAFCAGNCCRHGSSASTPPGFNEARAFCAGNSLPQLFIDLIHEASMRPARFAREIALPPRECVVLPGLQ